MVTTSGWSFPLGSWLAGSAFRTGPSTGLGAPASARRAEFGRIIGRGFSAATRDGQRGAEPPDRWTE